MLLIIDHEEKIEPPHFPSTRQTSASLRRYVKKKARGTSTRLMSIMERYFSNLDAGSMSHEDPLAFSVMNPNAFDGNTIMKRMAAVANNPPLRAIGGLLNSPEIKVCKPPPTKEKNM